MPPEPVFNTYGQYKADTSKIATWLASTAKGCGYVAAPAPAPSPGTAVADGSVPDGEGKDGKPMKLKGRARKLAKEREKERLKEEIESRAKRVMEGMTGDGSGSGSGNDGKGGAESGNHGRDGEKDAKEIGEGKGETKYVIQLWEFVPMAETIARSASQPSSSSNGGELQTNAEHKPKVKISTGLIKLFRRCIRARTGTKEWHESQTKDEKDKDDGEDGGHGYFIQVLQQALHVLVPVHELQELEARNFKIAKAKIDAVDGQNAVSGETLKVTNTFGQLEIEEVDEDAFQAMPSVGGFAGKHDPTSEEKDPPVRYEVEDDGEEWLFALYCLWGDMHEIQHYLKGLWLIYSEGKIDLATVAVVTNTAIDLVRRAEEDFNNADLNLPEPWSQPGMDQHLCNLYFMEACIRDGLSPPRESRECIVPLEAWEQVEESFLHVYRLLATSSTVGNKIGPIPITRPGWLGTYDPKLDRNKARVKRLFEQDAGLLSDMIVTIGPYTRLCNTPNDDELMKGVRDHLSRDKPPLWLVFAGQIFLDIHSMLKTKGEQPFNDLYDFALDARRTLRGHDKFFEKHTLTGFRNATSEGWVMDTHQEIEDWALNDKILQIFNEEMSVRKQMQSNRKSHSKKVRAWKENELLKMHPLLCGMWKYCFHLQMQVEGIRLVNETMIMAAAHLYNALQKCGYIPGDCLWVDAEYLLNIHASANTFLGDRPKTIEECTKRLAIAQGISPQTFASGRRTGGGQHRVVFAKTGGKFLSQTTPIAGVFRNRFLQNGSVDLSLGNIEIILGRRLDDRRKFRASLTKLGIDKTTLQGRNHMRKAVGLDPLTQGEWEDIQEKEKAPRKKGTAVEEGPFNGSASKDKKHKKHDCPCGKQHDAEELQDWDEAEMETLDRWEKEHKLSLCDFLGELGESLNDEQLDVEFDYFAFHRSTWRLLEAIQEACLPLVVSKVEEWMGEVLHTDEGVTIIPGMIMHMACDPRKSPNIVALKNWIDVDDRGLVAAAEIMKEFIEREGASFSKREKARLMKRTDMGWRSGDATGPGEGFFSGAVGNIRNVSEEESARILQGMTLEDATRRYDEKKGKGKNKKKKKKGKKDEREASTAEPVVKQEREKENFQPQVEDDSE